MKTKKEQYLNEDIKWLKKDYLRYCDDDFTLFNIVRNKRRIPGLDYMTWFRLTNAVKRKRLIFRMFLFVLRNKSIKYGFDIPYDTKIGGGCCIKHFGLLIINNKCIIGDNFTVAPGTVIGKSKSKVPVIGNNVHVGANVSIIGGISIGDNAIIGAGSVVVHSVEQNSIVVGNPARLLNYRE